MICVSIAEEGYDACLRAIDGLEFAEVRLDAALLSPVETRALFACGKRLVATFRPGNATDAERLEGLSAAIEGGAAYVDVELESAADFREAVISKAREKACAVIVSYHNFEKTPSRKSLAGIVRRCFGAGADVAKIACTVRSPRDNARLLGLLDSERKIVAVGMGDAGIMTRAAGPLLGAPFTFASLGPGTETAPGQLDSEALEGLMRILGPDERGAP